ncbi:TIM protein, partial [Cettia cetti]|nr:TIM protein [Cettia cetti]
VEEHWVPEEGAGQDLAQRLHQEGGQGSEPPAGLGCELGSCCHLLLSPGLAGPLRWLENCLRRVAGDREEDGVAQPVPLVPLMEENEDAMEDRSFQSLLRQLGLRPPASEQESFWRIPAALTPQQLRRAAASIAPRGPSGSPQDLPEPPRCPQHPAPGEGWGWGCGTPRGGAGSEPPSSCPSAEPLPAG